MPPTASQGRRKRRWLGGKEVGQVATESPATAAQESREGRRGAFDVSWAPMTANSTSEV
ncbi:hypothetical protein SPHINGOT1_610029 [Sphingomonas sp. T1]|nr:hypothetical protein SPHINGOT1_610029 [Sphingomonas sp. T1]